MDPNTSGKNLGKIDEVVEDAKGEEALSIEYSDYDDEKNSMSKRSR